MKDRCFIRAIFLLLLCGGFLLSPRAARAAELRSFAGRMTNSTLGTNAEFRLDLALSNNIVAGRLFIREPMAVHGAVVGAIEKSGATKLSGRMLEGYSVTLTGKLDPFSFNGTFSLSSTGRVQHGSFTSQPTPASVDTNYFSSRKLAPTAKPGASGNTPAISLGSMVRLAGSGPVSLLNRPAPDGLAISTVSPGIDLQVIQSTATDGVPWFRVEGREAGSFRNGWIRANQLDPKR